MLRAPRAVTFWFDLVSPYSWLALVAAPRFAEQHGVRFELEPIVYGVLLDRTGLTGPVETQVKRRYTMRDVVRAAELAGRRFVGPPAHPFRSLEALRMLRLWRDHARALELAVALADDCWAEGRDLTDLAVLAEVATSHGFDASGLAERIARSEIKESLRGATERALEAGVFGVPTFGFGSELFWGQDRLPHLAARLSGEIGPPDGRTVAMLERRVGAARPSARGPQR
jgi:2-hydroxychromene-2-carboxylate isomerase